MPTPEEKWTVGRLLSWTKDYLERQGVETPRLEAEVLLAHARGTQRIELYTAFTEEPTEAVRTAFRELVKRRAAGTPTAYLVGHREFYSLDFEVTPDVLIPRPETELLVIALLDHLKRRTSSNNEHPVPSVEIADVGTGSGILAVCAAKYIPNARITATDISPAAIAVAKRNAEKHKVADRIEFIESNLFANLPTDRQFDAIVSNPPYISIAEMANLAKDVREYEPKLALEAGPTGTEVIQPLIEQAAQRLKPGGGLFIEISSMIVRRAEQLVIENARFELGSTIRDLAGHERVLQIKLNSTLGPSLTQ